MSTLILGCICLAFVAITLAVGWLCSHAELEETQMDAPALAEHIVKAARYDRYSYEERQEARLHHLCYALGVSSWGWESERLLEVIYNDGDLGACLEGMIKERLRRQQEC